MINNINNILNKYNDTTHLYISLALNELDSATVIQTLSIPSQQTRELKAQQEQLQYQQQQDYQHRPWSTDDYYFRVNTYSIGKWFTKPSLIDPLQCSRFGWINCEPDMLECLSCDKRIQALRKTSISNVQKKDKRNLLKHCYRRQRLQVIAVKSKNLCYSGVMWLDYYSNNSNGNASDGSDHRDDNNHHINIHCSYCQRMLGLWNFKSMNNNNSDISIVTIDDPFIQLYPNLQTQTTSTSHNNNNYSSSTSLNVNNSLSSHTIGGRSNTVSTLSLKRGRESTLDIQQQQQQQEEEEEEATVEDRKKEKEIQLKLQQQLQSEQQRKCDVGWSWGHRFNN
ncbi:hypothetical protein PPL_09903 [Heterostelium album PN500]|uniref:C3HC-type domain-containing protein n=1 Tax=Heterostelium pallidum (strain ATCC 26659 / Pp 5 / PN500) TaxID=670386 RepID=D3BPD8_HETP5|nr:hypothetical protein PPL_09903 [Heterostelium album PN500]EFA77148.1 hypothetical protein PPL_09903 [Heterostelium album PN500]|eukprot:XP_020429277.1 hypothetical protein PPL_09903 [Heterostelium album PN500]